MKNTFELPLHTIMFTIGPSGSGKSYFCKNYLLEYYRVNYPNLSVRYLSSDDIRRELLGDDTIDKYDAQMLQVSEQAFNTMYHRLETYCSYPLNNELIIVDSTGLSKPFRQDMKKIANKYNYNLVPLIFSYNTNDEYIKYNEDVEYFGKEIIHKGVKRLKKEVLPIIKSERYTDIIKIQSKNFEDYTISFSPSDVALNEVCNVGKRRLFVVSDIHGCYDEFIELLEKEGYILENGLIKGYSDETLTEIPLLVINGDYLDKGPQTEEIITFIYYNLYYDNRNIKVIVGNHENYLYKRLNSMIESAGEDVEREHFTSLEFLSKNETIRNEFFYIFDNSLPFINSYYGYITHAPCYNKHIGKLSVNSCKEQRNFRYSRYKESEYESFDEYMNKLESEDFAFLEKEGIINSKPHYFGHVATMNTVSVKNKYFIDTACSSGNKLTGVRLSGDSSKPYFISVTSKREKSETIINLYDKRRIKENKDFYSELEGKEKKRIEFGIKNKVNFLSGTMSPSDKNEDEMVLEDLSMGLSYYKDRGVNRVILQPKYMGSYSNFYIFHDIDKCYATSRGGYNIDGTRGGEEINVPKYIYQDLQKHLTDDVEMILFAGELMPWTFLGKGLVDSLFKILGTSIQTEYSCLNDSGFFDKYKEMEETILSSDFYSEFNKLSKKEFIKKYSQFDYQMCKGYHQCSKSFLPKKEYVNYMLNFNKQVELYGSDEKAHFKPFSILKTVYKNSKEETCFGKSNIEIYTKISNDEYLVVDFSDENYLEKANDFYTRITTDKLMEGIVIKPEFIDDLKTLQYIKVRNENYLSIVYGFDYKKKNKYEKLISKKRLRNKIRLSLEEFDLGMRMLNIKYSDISEDNYDYKNLYARFISFEKQEQEVDPRL